MYRGQNHVSIGQQCVGEDLVVTTITGYTEDYSDDEPVPTTSTLNIRAQLRDLSKSEREFFATKYDINKMFVFYVKKDTEINIEDSFVRDNKKFTIVQTQEGLNYLMFFAIYDERM